ncbi:MAG: Fe-S cluster assembly ATPase SufC [Patescibacteria group bacterium]
MLKLQNITVSFQEKVIVHNVSLELQRETITVLMGPNGSGKSTLASALMGHPFYRMDATSHIELDGEDIVNLPPNERAQKGLFMGFQNPVAVAGVSLTKLLRETSDPKTMDTKHFMQDLRYLAKGLQFSEGLLIRGLNDGFSGGEKKKIEMVQARYLARKYALFDEVDTGLDVDALKKVAVMMNELKRKTVGCLIITHHPRLIEYLDVDRIIVMSKGVIVDEGGRELVKKIEHAGYAGYTH